MLRKLSIKALIAAASAVLVALVRIMGSGLAWTHLPQYKT